MTFEKNKQTNKKNQENLSETAVVFSISPQHVFTSSKYSCQTIFHSPCVLVLLHPFITAVVPSTFSPEANFQRASVPDALCLQHQQTPALPPITSWMGAGTSLKRELVLPCTRASGQGRRRDRQGGRGDPRSSEVGCVRPGRPACLKLPGGLFDPLPGLCFCCFWRRSLLEQERSN